MPIDFRETPRPVDAGGVWDRLVDLVRSMRARDVLFEGVSLVEGANPFAHGGRSRPEFVCPVVSDDAPSAVTLAVGVKTTTKVMIYATDACKADIWVRF
jgi:hypothetical protein